MFRLARISKSVVTANLEKWGNVPTMVIPGKTCFDKQGVYSIKIIGLKRGNCFCNQLAFRICRVYVTFVLPDKE